MTETGKMYALAFVKRAGVATFLRGAGKFLGSIPLWIGGATATSALIGKKPKVERVYIPRDQFRQLLSAQQEQWKKVPQPQHPYIMTRQ